MQFKGHRGINAEAVLLLYEVYMKTLEIIIKEAIYERLRTEKTVTGTAKSLGISRNTARKYLNIPFKNIEIKEEDICVD